MGSFLWDTLVFSLPLFSECSILSFFFFFFFALWCVDGISRPMQDLGGPCRPTFIFPTLDLPCQKRYG